MSDPHSFEIQGILSVATGSGGLPVIHITSSRSRAEIYLHGAHVTDFRKAGEEPLLFMSGSSKFEVGKAIRGGIPIIFPWFGAREGHPAHGTARITPWEITAAEVLLDGSVQIVFRMPDAGNLEVTYWVTVGESLGLQLSVTNRGGNAVTFENCLHTYFQIGDVQSASVHGLKDCDYFDKVLDAGFTESADAVRITGEVDRVFLDTTAALTIEDPVLARSIRIAKSGSLSTIVWNPWIAKSQAMADFGDNEYPHMLCVESGNVSDNRITLPPGETSLMTVELSSAPLD